MRLRGVLALLFLAACAGSPSPPRSSRLVVPAPSSAAALAPALEPLPDPADPATLDEAWRLWFAGKREPALARFRAVRRHLESAEPRGDGGAAQPHQETGAQPGAAGAALDAKDAILVVTDTELLSCDRGGTPRARIRPGGPVQTSPSSPIAVVTEGPRARALVAATLAPITDLPTSWGLPAALGDDAIGCIDNRAGSPHAVVFDVATRTERWSVPLGDVQPMALSFESGFFVAAGMPGALWDATTGRLVAHFGGGGAITHPAFSADGKLVAVTTPGVGKPGLVQLLDRHGKRLASASCGFTANAGFSANGAWLVVGDLRRACLFQLPKLRLLARSAELRPFAGPDDDLQELQQIEFVGEDSWVFLRTGDGTAAVAQVGGLTLAWKGRGELLPADAPGISAIVDREDTGEVVRIERTKLVSRALTEEQKQPGAAVDGVATPREKIVETLLSARLCHVGERTFPIEACAP